MRSQAEWDIYKALCTSLQDQTLTWVEESHSTGNFLDF